MSLNNQRVTSVADNYNFNVDKIRAGMILNYVNPLVSLPFLNSQINEESAQYLGSLVGLERSKGSYISADGKLLDENFVRARIANDLVEIVKNSLDKEDSEYLGNIVREVMKNKLVSKSVNYQEPMMSVDELMAKLYQAKSEKGMRK